MGTPKNSLEYGDLDDREKKFFKKIRVIGDTAPSCYPLKVNEFYNERPDNKIKARGTEGEDIKSLKQTKMLKRYLMRYVIKRVDKKNDKRGD